VKLIRRCGEEAIRPLLRLWLWAAQNRPDGVLSGMDAEDIEIAAGWTGDAQALHVALLETCLIDATPEGFVLHGWSEHQGWACHAKERSERAKKAAAARWGDKKEAKKSKNDAQPSGEQCSEHAGSNAQALQDDDLSNAPSPNPSPNPSPKPKDSCSEPSSGSEPAAAEESPTEPQPVILLPTNKRGEEYPVTQDHVREWEELYPAVDVMQELRNMRGWLLHNKSRRKTASGMPRFINNWLTKEQNNARASPGPQGQAMRQQTSQVRSAMVGALKLMGGEDDEIPSNHNRDKNSMPIPIGSGVSR